MKLDKNNNVDIFTLFDFIIQNTHVTSRKTFHSSSSLDSVSGMCHHHRCFILFSACCTQL